MRIAECYIHPIKSCASLAREALDIEPRGPKFDRRYMVVDTDGRFLTGRKLPRMVLVRATPDEHGLQLAAPDMPPLSVATPDASAQRMAVSVWGDEVSACTADSAADAWLSTFLERDVRLAYMDATAMRRVNPDRGEAGDVVSFADSCPLLLIGQSALDQLNDKVSTDLPMTRFRPNLVFNGGLPHAEDAWRRVRIGGLRFDVLSLCTRCVFTTVDPGSGEFDPGGEPLATLRTYRRGPSGITFGVNLIARDSGELRVGDALEVLA